MSYINVEVEVDVDDFISSCDRRDIKYLIESLIEEGHLDESVIYKNKSKYPPTPGEELHRDNCTKIYNNYYQMSNEDVDLIESIAKKY
jgi:hypothetical protein